MKSVDWMTELACLMGYVLTRVLTESVWVGHTEPKSGPATLVTSIPNFLGYLTLMALAVSTNSCARIGSTCMR